MRALLLALTACGARARAVEPSPTPAPWCFALRADHDGRDRFALACADGADLCAWARDRAIALSAVASISEVGACRVRP